MGLFDAYLQTLREVKISQFYAKRLEWGAPAPLLSDTVTKWCFYCFVFDVLLLFLDKINPRKEKMSSAPITATSAAATASIQPVAANQSATANKNQAKTKVAFDAPLLTKDLKDRIDNAIVTAMKEMCTANAEAYEGLEKNPERLDGGIHYATTYGKVLKTLGTDKAEALLKHLINNNDFNLGRAPKKYFDRLMPNEFVVRKGKLPSEALLGIRKGLTFVDCFATCVIAQYFGLLEALGKDKFDIIFSRDSCFPLTIGRGRAITLKLFSKACDPKAVVDLKSVKKAQMVYIASVRDNKPNQPTYDDKHGAIGIARGYWGICTEPSMHNSEPIIHALGLDKTGQDHTSIILTLNEAYNSKPVDPTLFSSKLPKGDDKLKDHTYNYGQFIAAGGGALKNVPELNYEAIAAFAVMSVKQVQNLVAKYTAKAQSIEEQFKTQLPALVVMLPA